jgi:hypothetical protein
MSFGEFDVLSDLCAEDTLYGFEVCPTSKNTQL